MVSPVTLLLGDPFLAEEKRKSILQSLKSESSGEIAVVSYSLSEIKLEQILAEARTLPFLISSQIFVLSQSQLIKDKIQDMLAAYLENPTTGTFFIFESEQLEKSSKFAKLIGKYGEVITLDERQKKSAGTRFIQDKLRSCGKTMVPGAMRRLDEQVGGMPAFLDSILNQVIAYAGEEKVITEEMVEKFEENWQEVDVFTLMNALANRRTEQALNLLEQILEDSGNDVYALMGLLHWQMRRFWLARFYFDQGEPENVVFKRCKVYPKQASFFLRQVRNFSLEQLEQAVENLFQLDWKVKTGRVEGTVALERWVIETTA